jgi:signal transduction histidine kinase
MAHGQHHEVQLIGEKLNYQFDDSGEKSYQEMLAALDDFENLNTPVFYDNARPGRLWIQFDWSNTHQQDLWVELANSNLTEIQFFKYNPAWELVDSITTGCLYPDDTRATSAYTFQFPILESNEKGIFHFLLGIQTNLNYEVPIFLGSYHDIISNRSSYDIWSIFFLGAVSLMLFYNVFIYAVTRSKIYIYYVAYLGSTIIIGTYLNNFPVIEVVFGKELAYNFLDLWLWLIFGTTAGFTIYYFNLKKLAPLLHKILLGFVGVFVLFGIANIFLPLHMIANYFQVLAVIFYSYCLFIGYYLLIKGNRRAILFAVGWTGMIVSAIMYIMIYNGLLPYNAFFRNITYFGTLFEVLIFSIALGLRINSMRIKEKNLNTSLIAKNSELLAVNESLDSFNYHVSHDLKTVINNNRSLTRMAIKYNQKNDSKKLNEILSKMNVVNEHGAETVSSFLALGQVDRIFKETTPDRIAFKTEMNQLIQKHNFEDKIQIEYNRVDFDKITLHKRAFDSIFQNLISNSIKYQSEREPLIILNLIQQKAQIKIVYQDNGLGIDMEKYGKLIFQPFERAGQYAGKEGSGIGLYLVKRIVEGYGGQITLESQPGQGVTFKILLPQNQ